MTQKLKNKVAVITGGNSGIGAATAARFKEEGADVIILGRSEEKTKTAADDLGVAYVIADVANVTALDHAVQEIEQRYGRIDTLFVNAGVFQPTPVGAISEESFDYQVGINLKEMMPGLFGRRQRQSVTVAQAREILKQQEAEKLIDQRSVAQEARERVEQGGLIFLDEKADRDEPLECLHF